MKITKIFTKNSSFQSIHEVKELEPNPERYLILGRYDLRVYDWITNWPSSIVFTAIIAC